MRRPGLHHRREQLRHARSCYDHLAGEVGVAVMAALTKHRLIRLRDGRRIIVTAAGRDWFAALGLDIAALPSGRCGIARACLDGTERRHHLAGPLGKSLLAKLIALRWLRRKPGTRAVTVTAAGRHELAQRLGTTLARQPRARKT